MSHTKEELQIRYRRSLQLLAEAGRVIPTASQTFSKSAKTYPAGAAPLFLRKGSGSRVWDVDGNEYLDFVSALGTIILGHCDPDVTAAVQEQLQEGILFSLPSPLELEVANRMRELIPCAEMIRFGKNGSDATTGAIRLARGFTRRDHVLVCGYHGWQDWYIGSTPANRGVPQVVQGLTHNFAYNDIEAVDRLFRTYPDAVAAVILEPMNIAAPKPGYLEELKELTHRNGALFIFDEMVTGFRFAMGGAQELFGVIPDVATFGKAMANGYPISAIVGKAEIMECMDDIFVSLTYGGETLSLAATLATVQKLQRKGVIRGLYERGESLTRGVEQLVAKHDVGHIVGICGNPTWSFLAFEAVGGYTDWQIKTLFLQEVLARGLLTMGFHFISDSHGDAEVSHLLRTYDEVFPLLKLAVDERAMERLLAVAPLEPQFKVRGQDSSRVPRTVAVKAQ